MFCYSWFFMALDFKRFVRRRIFFTVPGCYWPLVFHVTNLFPQHLVHKQPHSQLCLLRPFKWREYDSENVVPTYYTIHYHNPEDNNTSFMMLSVPWGVAWLVKIAYYTWTHRLIIFISKYKAVYLMVIDIVCRLPVVSWMHLNST
jgi:hypothetical protein